ncbi:MAG: PQQ-like beta-propeller repeat protein [Phycisphaeraceae bacterium]|nr:PQQ-like beta-propeller repeat protein [Phycisphaeraceae bacterium]
MKLSCLAAAVMALSAAGLLAADEGPLPRVIGFDDYTRYEVTLSEALPGDHDLTLYLGRQGGEFRQAWSQVVATGKVAERVDVSGLEVDDGRLSGRVEMWTQTDDNSPMYEAIYELDVPVEEGRIDGRYRGHYSVRTGRAVYATESLIVRPEHVRLFAHGDPIEGLVLGQTEARADPGRLMRFDLDLGMPLQGPTATGHRRLGVTFITDGGRAGSVNVVPRVEGAWDHEVTEAELTFSDDRLRGGFAFNLTPRSPTRGGRYRFEIDANVEVNLVAGGVVTYLDGERVAQPAVRGNVEHLTAGRAPLDDAVYHLTLVNAHEGAANIELALDRRGGQFEHAVATGGREVEQFDLEVDNRRRLRGSVKILMDPDGGADGTPVYAEVEVDALLTDAGISGRYEGRYGQRREVAGDLAGRVRSQEQLQQAERLAAGLDWPAWNGPNSNFTATPSGHELIDRLDEARLVWKGEHIPPGRCQTNRYGEGNIVRYLTRGGAAGGSSSPVVADSMVYLYYFRPTGEQVADVVEQWAERGTRTLGAEMWALEAEDVVLAMDAATGQTVWKTVVPGGRYYSWQGTGRAKGAYTANTAVGGGRVYFHGSGNRTMCLDARSGELLWMNDRGGEHVVALEDMAVFSGSHVTALDGRTGEVRWRIENAGESTAAPLHWRHDGKSYIISGNRNGRVVCIEADTGEIRWELENVGNNRHTMAIAERHLLCDVGDKRLGAYRISPDGAEKAWSLPREYSYILRWGKMPAVHDGRVYFHSHGETGQAGGENHVMMIDVESGEILEKIPADIGGPGHVQWFDNRLIVQQGAWHSRTELKYYLADGERLESLGDIWRPPHRHTSGYGGFMMPHAIVDGRIYIRGARGIYCYDLRKQND